MNKNIKKTNLLQSIKSYNKLDFELRNHNAFYNNFPDSTTFSDIFGSSDLKSNILNFANLQRVNNPIFRLKIPSSSHQNRAFRPVNHSNILNFPPNQNFLSRLYNKVLWYYMRKDFKFNHFFFIF